LMSILKKKHIILVHFQLKNIFKKYSTPHYQTHT
jgi:hypothetical protein